MQLVPNLNLQIDGQGRICIGHDQNDNQIIFDLDPQEKRFIAERLLRTAAEDEAKAYPIVETALAKAQGRVQ